MIDAPESAAPKKTGLSIRHVLLAVLLGAVVFGALIAYGDLSELAESLRRFPLALLPAVLALALGNYVIRWVRWAYYLRTLDIHVELSTNVLVFGSGLSMSITPGKLGELAKCYLLSETRQVPASRSSPAVIMERVTDIVAVFILSTWGLTALPGRLVAISGVAIAVLLGVLLAAIVFARGPLLRLPPLKRWESQIVDSRENFARLLRIRPILVGCSLGMLAWLSEGVGLWLVLRGLDSSLSLVHAVSIYAAASLVGALAMLPGGVVGTEGSMVGLLRGMDLTRADASAATIIIRLCTLWFAVLVGLVALGLFYRVAQRGKPSVAGARVD